jgi:hypothetical protein
MALAISNTETNVVIDELHLYIWASNQTKKHNDIIVFAMKIQLDQASNRTDKSDLHGIQLLP